jgi:bacterioferritin
MKTGTPVAVMATVATRSGVDNSLSESRFQSSTGGIVMAKKDPSNRGTETASPVDRKALIALLNEDLAREYQAIIAYVVYSQVLKGATYMAISKELEVHATEELQHAFTIAKQVDYLGGTPAVVPKPVKLSDDPKDLLRFDLENETETIRQYRDRVKQCEALGEYAISEHIREILKQEQEHLIDLATALGEDPPII